MKTSHQVSGTGSLGRRWVTAARRRGAREGHERPMGSFEAVGGPALKHPMGRSVIAAAVEV